MKRKTELILEASIWPGIHLLGFIETLITSGNSKVINNILLELKPTEELTMALLLALTYEVVSFQSEIEKISTLIEKNNASIRGINSKIDSIFDKYNLINKLNGFSDSFNNLKKPYFIKLINKRLKRIIDNREFKSPEPFIVDLTEITSPSSQETFGSEGTKDTQNNLKFISSFDDYWEDQGDTEYDKVQYELIKRDVSIKRLFVDHSVIEIQDSKTDIERKEKNFESLKKLMEKQSNKGMNVKYIPATEVKDDFKNKDGLIQDDDLLVELVKGYDGKHKTAKEIITMNPYPVQEILKEFDSYWNQAKEWKKAEEWRSSKCLNKEKVSILLFYGLPCSGKTRLISGLSNRENISVDTIIKEIIPGSEPTIQDFINLSKNIIERVMVEINEKKGPNFAIEMGCLIPKSEINFLEAYLKNKSFKFRNIVLTATDKELNKRIEDRNTKIDNKSSTAIRIEGPDYLSRFRNEFDKNMPNYADNIDTTKKPITELISCIGL
jgi:hypothetical protein